MRLSLSVLILGLLVAVAAPAQAQRRCPEGRTFAGDCVKPELAQVMRKSAIVYSLPKFSYTAPPMLPSEDSVYAVPRDYNEARQLFCVGAPAVLLTGPGVTCR
ncbi:MAG TPA: hypothetical protein VLX09_12880 [Stellaceae bacterium]|nr:hypothetical protein [Xanthobacteraceae bacterium]HUK08759.1 hypothetical protein [Stellaceae bacterium]